jgi:hypothetical protein
MDGNVGLIKELALYLYVVVVGKAYLTPPPDWGAVYHKKCICQPFGEFFDESFSQEVEFFMEFGRNYDWEIKNADRTIELGQRFSTVYNEYY